MSVKLTQVSTFFCALLLLLCLGGSKVVAQVGPVSISGPTTVTPGSVGIYSLVPTVSGSTYVAWNVTGDGQIISAPPNTGLEGYGINTCYVTWGPNIQTVYLTVTLARNTPIQQYTLRITRGTGLNGADSYEVVKQVPAAEKIAESRETPLKR